MKKLSSLLLSDGVELADLVILHEASSIVLPTHSLVRQDVNDNLNQAIQTLYKAIEMSSRCVLLRYDFMNKKNV